MHPPAFNAADTFSITSGVNGHGGKFHSQHTVHQAFQRESCQNPQKAASRSAARQPLTCLLRGSTLVVAKHRKVCRERAAPRAWLCRPNSKAVVTGFEDKPATVLQCLPHRLQQAHPMRLTWQSASTATCTIDQRSCWGTSCLLPRGLHKGSNVLLLATVFDCTNCLLHGQAFINRTAQYRLVTTRVMWFKSKPRGSAQLPGWVSYWATSSISKVHTRDLLQPGVVNKAHTYTLHEMAGPRMLLLLSDRKSGVCCSPPPTGAQPDGHQNRRGRSPPLESCTGLHASSQTTGAGPRGLAVVPRGGERGAPRGSTWMAASKTQQEPAMGQLLSKFDTTQKREDGKRPHGKRAARHRTRARSV